MWCIWLIFYIASRLRESLFLKLRKKRWRLNIFETMTILQKLLLQYLLFYESKFPQSDSRTSQCLSWERACHSRLIKNISERLIKTLIKTVENFSKFHVRLKINVERSVKLPLSEALMECGLAKRYSSLNCTILVVFVWIMKIRSNAFDKF